MKRRQALRSLLTAVVGALVFALAPRSQAKGKGGRGKSRGRGKGGSGRRSRGGYRPRSHTVSHTGVIKRIGDPRWFEERQSMIRELHDRYMRTAQHDYGIPLTNYSTPVTDYTVPTVE